VAVHVLALSVELHLPASRSLKAKRSVVKSIIETCRHRYAVAASETGHQDTWQRAELAFAAVAGAPGQCTDVIDEVERYVWSVPDAEVVEVRRDWMEVDR
jgi:uncharacterized protein YlxP (DUF503 family)